MADKGRTCEHPDYPEPQEHRFDNDAGARVEMAQLRQELEKQQKEIEELWGLLRGMLTGLAAVHTSPDFKLED